MHQKFRNEGSESAKQKCPNCSEYQLGKDWYGNNLGCTAPAAIGLILLFPCIFYPPLAVVYFPLITIGLVVGLYKDYNRRKVGFTYYKCDHCKIEGTWDGEIFDRTK